FQKDVQVVIQAAVGSDRCTGFEVDGTDVWRYDEGAVQQACPAGPVAIAGADAEGNSRPATAAGCQVESLTLPAVQPAAGKVEVLQVGWSRGQNDTEQERQSRSHEVTPREPAPRARGLAGGSGWLTGSYRKYGLHWRQ